MSEAGKSDCIMNASVLHAKSVSELSMPVTVIGLPSISNLNFVTTLPGWHWHWYYIIYLLLAWQTTTVIWKFWWKAPVVTANMAPSIHALTLYKSNIIIAAYPTPLGRWLTALHMMVYSETLLQKAYKSVCAERFYVIAG